MTTEFKMPEPVYLFRRHGLADFVTCDKSRYEHHRDYPFFDTATHYTSADMRAVIEQCAKICKYEHANIFGQSREGSLASCEERIRKLLEQVK